MTRQTEAVRIEYLRMCAGSGMFGLAITSYSICGEALAGASLHVERAHQAARPRRLMSSPRILAAVASTSTYGSLPT
jgi:hypothetical protein